MNKRHVYLMECGGRYKVGVSADTSKRLRQLDNRPFPVMLLASSQQLTHPFEAEREIHEWLEAYRVSGEWYDIPDDLLQSVIKTVNDMDDYLYETEVM